MKKCPFCKADIEDNARFCLYCMKPLNEKKVIPPPQRKKQWWLFALAAFLTTLLAVLLLIPRQNADLPAEPPIEENLSTGQTTTLQADDTTGESTDHTQNDPAELPDDTTLEKARPDSGAASTNQKPTQNQNNNTQQPVDTKPIQPEIPAQTTPVTTPSQATEPEITVPDETHPPETEPEKTEPDAPKTEIVYTYRAARAGDDFNANYNNSGNDIVITGIRQQSTDGTYDIPSYIDGKKVIAIVANAFSGSNAKIVYIPATVKNIWNYSFSGCNLTDIYFRGNSIYTEGKAFSANLTIHCSASCSDRNFRYYKNCAASYGATWKEWNG